WAGGGHHPSLVLLPGELDPLVLASEGVMMGVLRNVEFPAETRRMPENARLVIFSDGVFEIFRQGRQVWNLADCIAHLAVLGREQDNLMDKLFQYVQRLRGSPHLDDDFSIIEAQFH
ncbi:MAG: SpoIIE family protein phosphatase, partial [Verrucomicrobia bacterium]|nr:SpoIIE family protein phosphatase [Verrucomicrobiota bacterium]